MARYYHVDVFTDVAYTGNSLAVFADPPPLDSGQMLRITQELRHFETIFVTTLTEPDTVRARVFDLFGELDFAGHPVLGAAGVLHELRGSGTNCAWTFELPARTVQVTTRLGDGNLVGVIDQGRPELITPAAPLEPGPIAQSLGLAVADLDPELPPQPGHRRRRGDRGRHRHAAHAARRRPGVTGFRTFGPAGIRGTVSRPSASTAGTGRQPPASKK